MTSTEGYSSYESDGEAAVEADTAGLDIVVSGSLVTFTFTNTSIDLDSDGNADVILDGSFSTSDSGATITFDNYKVTNPGNTAEYMFINGNITSVSGAGSTTYTSNFTISGSVLSSSVTVSTVMTMPDSGTPIFTSAVIDGTDYTTVFNQVLSDF